MASFQIAEKEFLKKNHLLSVTIKFWIFSPMVCTTLLYVNETEADDKCETQKGSLNIFLF